ncbi:MAG: hypothetical protein Q4A00_06630 [Flavobacteriaceae bacterium]|nr:hypothetical protein [Flavobacteriaceae bacterium]
MKIKSILNVFFCFSLLLLVSSCSSIGLLDERNSWILEDIDSIGDFIQVYIVLQVSIFLISFLLSFILGDLANVISVLIHFIWIVSYRDYGFFIVLLLFGLFAVVSHFVMLLIANRK